MASSMPRGANGKNGAKKASAALETEHSQKKFKSSDISFPPPTIETPKGSKQGSPSHGKNRNEDLHNKYHRIYQALENRDVFLKLVEAPPSPGYKAYLDGLSCTQVLEKIKDEGFKHLVCLLEVGKKILTSEDDFKKAKTSLEDTISRQDERISLLKSDMDLKDFKLAEAEAKLKESELSKAHLSSRVESLEAELNGRQVEIEFLKSQAVTSEQKASHMAKIIEMQKYSEAHFSSRIESLEAELNRKQAEIEFLKNEAVASENKASRVANKIFEMQKYSKALSTAAAKAVKDLKSSEEKSQDSDANLLLHLASSNQA